MKKSVGGITGIKKPRFLTSVKTPWSGKIGCKQLPYLTLELNGSIKSLLDFKEKFVNYLLPCQNEFFNWEFK